MSSDNSASVLVRAAEVLDGFAEDIYLCHTIEGEWPVNGDVGKDEHRECRLLARQLRALAEERRLGPREG